MSDVRKELLGDKRTVAGEDEVAGRPKTLITRVATFEEQIKAMQAKMHAPAQVLSTQLGGYAFAETFKGAQAFTISGGLVHASGEADIAAAVRQLGQDEGQAFYKNAKKVEDGNWLLSGGGLQQFIAQGREPDVSEEAYLVFPSQKAAVKALEVIKPLMPPAEEGEVPAIAVYNFEGRPQAYLQVPLDVVHQINGQLIRAGNDKIPIEDIPSLDYLKREIDKLSSSVSQQK